ncbi:PIN domain-containing protein [Variibacter gotjawalensis]|nr:PIN domain-containing protein [Variibacter gotjawalensis]
MAAELRYGCAKRASMRLTERVEGVLSRLHVLPLTAPVDREYAEIRTDAERTGRNIGPNDLWIAAHARSLGVPLVTANEREFRTVRGLNIENWLR